MPKGKYIRKTPRREKSAIIAIGPSIAYIALTKGVFALIDIEDADLIGRFLWHSQWCKNTGSFYANRTVEGSLYAMHRIVNGTPKGLLTDHINRNTLDNRRSNLRNATNSQNMLNKDFTAIARSTRPRNKGGRGWIESRGNKWCYVFKVKKEKVRSKTFCTKHDAQHELDKVRVERFGVR